MSSATAGAAPRAPVSHLKLIGRGHFLKYSRLEAVVWEAVRRSVARLLPWT